MTAARSEAEAAAGRNTSLARGTVFGVGGQMWQLITAFLLYHYLSARFGKAIFGEWRVTLSILNYFEMIVTGGLVQVAAKRIAEDPTDASRLAKAAYVGQMAFAGTLFLLLELTAGLIASALNAPYLASLIRIAALDIPLVAAFLLASNLQLGHGHFTRQVVGMLAYATAKFVAIGALVLLGYSVVGALIGNALSSIVGFAVLFVPWEKAGIRFRETVAEARGMGVAAVPFLARNLVTGVTSDADLWFVQALRGSAAAGLYGAATALAEIMTFLFAALSRVLFPSIARAGAEGNETRVARYATQGVRLALLVTVLGVGVIAATGAQALTFVYTAEFAAAALPFTVLMVASVGRNVGGTCSDIMLARGQRRQAIAMAIGMTIGDIALLAVLTPAFGMVGAAAAASVATLAATAVGIWTLRALLGWRVVWTLLRASVASAVVFGGLALAHPVGFWLLPAYVAAALGYALVLYVLREFDADDIESLVGVVRRGR